jgi:protein-S-isoprenylcysteine O-methyltransferase Ste14
LHPCEISPFSARLICRNRKELDLWRARRLSNWSRIARRIRVPLGFVLAVVYLALANPSWKSVLLGAAVAVLGVALRAAASGHVQKNALLATTGPYAYTRNPLYLGSAIIGIGFAIAARSPWIVFVLCLLFIFIYVPVVKSEETFLRSRFSEYDEYARRVPRFVPHLTFARENPLRQEDGFSRELYCKHREYNAALGAAFMLAALVGKLLLKAHL